MIKQIGSKGISNFCHSSTLSKSSTRYPTTFKSNFNFGLTPQIVFSMSGRKLSSLNKELSANSSYMPSKSIIDLQSLAPHERFRVIKEGINEAIDSKLDKSQLVDLLESFSNMLINNQKLKDGLVEFQKVVKKLNSIPAFKASPVLHYSLCEYRYYLIRAGKIDEAIAVSETSYNLLKKASQKDSLHIASELCTLGVLHFMNKNIIQGRKTLENQLNIRLKNGDQTYTQAVDCKNNLAIIDFVEGKYEQAQKTFQANAQLTKRIIKSTKKTKQQLYAKHYVYLETLYEMKLAQTESESEKVLLKQKIKNCLQQAHQIMKENSQAFNDFHLYYQTIGQHFLNAKKYNLSIKFMKKALFINEKKMGQPFVTNRSSRNLYEISNTISRELRILGQSYECLGQQKLALESYVNSFKRYKKDLLSHEAKQMISEKDILDYVECCKLLFKLKFKTQKNPQKAFTEALQYIETPLLSWNEMIKNVWNLPQRFIFIPYELNIEIGIKLLQFAQTQGAMQYFSICVKQIEAKKNLLCNKSRKGIQEVSQRFNKAIQSLPTKQVKNIAELKNIKLKLSHLSKS